MKNEKPVKISLISRNRGLKDAMCSVFKERADIFVHGNLSVRDIAEIIKISPDVIVIDIAYGAAGKYDACRTLKKDFATAYIPVITLVPKSHLKRHFSDIKESVDDYLVKPADISELRIRAEMAVKRSRNSFYANSLTGLPGGIVIEEVLKARLKGGRPFVAGHIDIDNFKSFNDKYGYWKGDSIIMQTAHMLTTSVKNWGNADDFVGHIGGDDFVLVTSPEKYNPVCKNFICMFDTIIPFHYLPDDRKLGYIVSKSRTNRLCRLPLMSVTIALVMKNGPGEIDNIIDLNERTVEVKQYLKKISGSKYMADRRISNKNDHLKVQVFSNEESLACKYKPLGQILLEKKLVTLDQLDRALKAHWKRRKPLGEILTELGFLTECLLLEALSFQGKTLGKDTRR